MDPPSTPGRAASLRDAAALLLCLALLLALQFRLSFVGLFADDYLLFRPYASEEILGGFHRSLSEVFWPGYRSDSYRPLTPVAQAAVFEIFGFGPERLFWARVLLLAVCAAGFHGWLRTIGLSAFESLPCVAVFLAFPANVFSFAWNLMMGALSGLVWMFLALLAHTRGCERGSARWRALGLLCLALAMLTNEVFLPVFLAFPLLDLVGSRRGGGRIWFRAIAPPAAVAAAYVAVRTAVLGGTVAHGWSPAPPGDPGLAAGYGRYLGWMALATPPRLLEWGLAGSLVFLVPLAAALAAAIRALLPALRGGGGAGGAIGGRLRALSPTERAILPAAALLLGAGAIAAFYPHPRVFFVGSVGAAVLLGALPTLAGPRLRGGRFSWVAGAAFAAVLGAMALAHVELGDHPGGEFRRLKPVHQLRFYYLHGEIFRKFGLEEQAAVLHRELREEGLIDEAGRPLTRAIEVLLMSKGMAPEFVSGFTREILRRPGAMRFR